MENRFELNPMFYNKISAFYAKNFSLELLKAIIVSGGSDVSQDQLADLLWPDADGDSVRRSLDTTLHRLRKLLKYEKVVKLQAGKLTLDARCCWVDAVAFESVLSNIDDLLSKENTLSNGASTLHKKALSLYKGEFMKGEVDADWIFSFRERLRNRFFRKLALLGKFRERSAEWDSAVDIYLYALEMDELYEEFYQRLMICYQKQGLKAQAVSTYERCRKIFSTVQGVKPSYRTEEIYRNLRGD